MFLLMSRFLLKHNNNDQNNRKLGTSTLLSHVERFSTPVTGFLNKTPSLPAPGDRLFGESRGPSPPQKTHPKTWGGVPASFSGVFLGGGRGPLDPNNKRFPGPGREGI